MDKGLDVKAWEVLLILVGMFFIVSTSLYWYDHFNLTKNHSIEQDVFRKDVRNNIDGIYKWQNGVSQWQTQVANILNYNLQNGKLLSPPQEVRK